MESLVQQNGVPEYKVQIVYDMKQSPQVTIIEPELLYAKGQTHLPHVYPGNVLCLFDPEEMEWNNNQFIADTAIPWTSLWLFYYEGWLSTGKWGRWRKTPKYKTKNLRKRKKMHESKYKSEKRSKEILSKRRTPNAWPDNKEFRILTIDGGGIKGIFPACFLEKLESNYLNGNSITDYFDLICGTSTGGIIALGLGAGIKASELSKLYIKKRQRYFSL